MPRTFRHGEDVAGAVVVETIPVQLRLRCECLATFTVDRSQAEEFDKSGAYLRCPGCGGAVAGNRKPANRPAPNRPIQQVLELRKTMGYDAIAAELDIHRSVVYRILKRAGATKSNRWGNRRRPLKLNPKESARCT